MTTVLDKLIRENEFPVVFLGSGISKRFLDNLPNWIGLLEEFWVALGLENFYGELNNIRDHIKNDHPLLSGKEVEHYSNIKIGTILEEKFNRAFNNGKITIKGFSTKQAFETKISPFKKAISERFKNYTHRSEMKDEYNIFKKMLIKTQIILTTNYDKFIEDAYNESSNHKISKYIGQKGFFQETFGYAELYKLHGCVDSPEDIIITERDYSKFESNSVLISAKIISMMLHSPIIFIGYSLTDINVRKIIREFTKSLTDKEIQILEDRLILIERKANEPNLVEEIINDSDLGCKLKVIRTANYRQIFEKISSINQGIAPTEVRKYQHVIKKLIIDRGKKGALKSLLLSPEELDTLEANLQNKNITVALGDAKYIFQIPDTITYCIDYITDKDEISNDIRMRFAVIQNGTARFPINKFLDRKLIEESTLHETEKQKLINKIDIFTDFEKHSRSINSSSVLQVDKLDVETITGVEAKKHKIYESLSFYIRSLNLDELKAFLISELQELKDIGEIKVGSELRRLLLLYDIIKYKRDND